MWKICLISDLGEVVGGATPSTKDTDNYNGIIPWITPKDLSIHKGRYIYRGERNISKKGYDSCSTQIMPVGTVLFSSRAPIGYIAITQSELCTNQGFKSVIPNNNTDSMFLYYLLLYNKKLIENAGSGTIFKEVSGSVMKNISVRVPDLSEQRAIAATLSCLDDKIELNNKINANLEAQAQAIFKSWFVDFEPFQDGEFVDSELGMIPKGWRVGMFSDLIDKVISGDWGKEATTGNYTKEVYCIRGADIPDIDEGHKGKMPLRFILPKNYGKKKIQNGDLVIEISGGSPTQSTGRIIEITGSLLLRYNHDMICTNFCKAVSINQGYSRFVYRYWKHFYQQNVMFSYENGTTGIKNFAFSDFVETHPIVIPPKEMVKEFNSITDCLSDVIYQNGAQTENLATLRDTLLPRLMSGEIEVPVAKAIIQERS